MRKVVRFNLKIKSQNLFSLFQNEFRPGIAQLKSSQKATEFGKVWNNMLNNFQAEGRDGARIFKRDVIIKSKAPTNLFIAYTALRIKKL